MNLRKTKREHGDRDAFNNSNFKGCFLALLFMYTCVSWDLCPKLIINKKIFP
jgi:hypothetical protein